MTNPLFDLPSTPKARPKAKRTPTRPKLTEPAKRALESRGFMDPLTGATRSAKRSRCSECGAGIWRGIDADWCGQAIDADVMALTPAGEVLALTHGWRTRTVRSQVDRYVLDCRDQFHRRDPAGSVRNSDVLTEHVCGTDISRLPHQPSRLENHLSLVLPTECPF